MPSTAVACIGQHSVCAIRATRLAADCTPMTGASNTVVTAGMTTVNLTPDVDAGTKYEPKNGCGKILWTDTNPDIIKRYNIDAEFAVFDYELISLLTDASLIMGAAGGPWTGKSVGVGFPGPTTVRSKGVALEIWTKTGSGMGECGPNTANPQFVRHVLPRCILRPDAHAFADAVAMIKVMGTAEVNPLFNLGPYGDSQALTVDTSLPYYSTYDVALPTTGCGFVS